MDIPYNDFCSPVADSLFSRPRQPASREFKTPPLLATGMRYLDAQRNEEKDWGAMQAYYTKIDYVEGFSEQFSSYDSGFDGYSIFISSITGVYPFRFKPNSGGWRALTNVNAEKELSRIHATEIFINDERKKTFVMLENAETYPSEKWITTFVSILPCFLPWLYPLNLPIPEEEAALFKAVYSGDLPTFQKIIESAAERIGLKNRVLKKTISVWMDATKNSLINAKQRVVDALLKDIGDLVSSVAHLSRELEEETLEISALNLTRNNPKEQEEAYRFLTLQKEIVVEVEATPHDFRDSPLVLGILSEINFFDEDAFLSIFNNKKSCLYSGFYDERTIIILHGIFGLNKGKLRTASFVSFKGTNTMNMIKESTKTFADLLKSHKENYIPHPHLSTYACLGTAEADVLSATAEGNWELGLEIVIGLSHNINFCDSVVIGRFVCDFPKYYNYKVIIADNGEEMTPLEFLKYIEE